MRILLFIVLMIACTVMPWQLLFLLGIAYALYFEEAYELILLAVLIDGYYGVNAPLPYYTVSTVALLLVVEWAKPRLLIYNEL